MKVATFEDRCTDLRDATQSCPSVDELLKGPLPMPISVVDGIPTEYEVLGSGPPLLMFSPGGFDAIKENWSTQGIYGQVQPLSQLSKSYTCLIFDRRESGSSGGRVERLTWDHYANQGLGLLRHLGFGRAHVMGGCMGCPPALALAVAHPEVVTSLVLYWPVGGARYRIRGHRRFAIHLAYATENGLEAVVQLVKAGDARFGQDARVGPWSSVIRHDEAFAAAYGNLDVDRYALTLSGIANGLFDRDTSPGAEAEDLLGLEIPALIVPGQDASHPTSAARYLEECLPLAQYWDAPVPMQTSGAACGKLLEFLGSFD